MSEKVKVIQKDTFNVIVSAVNKAVNLIRPTFGPASNKVIISKLTHGFVLDDGVQIARDLELADPAENAILKLVRETAIKTNDRVGDGTTGALILIQAIINEVDKANKFKFFSRNDIDGRKIEKELKAAAEEIKHKLLESAKDVETAEDLYKIALVSFDDKKIAKLIADAWFQLGKDGVLTVDRSNTMETVVELTKGITINNGYLSPYMITNPQRMEAVIEKPYILFTDYRLTEAKDVIEIMGKLVAKNIHSLIIIAENIEQSALATINVNNQQGKFKAVAINAPTGENKTQILEDMALATGGRVFSEKKGDKVEEAEIEDLGRSERFIARRDESVIVNPKGDKQTIDDAVLALHNALESETKESVKKDIKKRIATFNNEIGVVKVGAPTDNELNALRYKIEDAVNAVHAAFKSGVVAGGGVALKNITTPSDILNKALRTPFKQLKINVGLKKHRHLYPNEAINVVTGEIGDWQDVGVMDPVDVLIAQVESAVSIASILVTATGMIVEKPEHLMEE